MARDSGSQELATELWQGRPRVVWTAQGRQELATATSSLRDGLHKAFLPEGWPESVTSDYLSFQVWDSIQAVCSYVRGILTSQAIMRGIGVGKEAATPLGAVFQFFVRDLTGMVGGILFAYYEGSSFDSCAKQWRLFADIANNAGMVIEMASPFFPSMFLLMACLGSLARAVTGVAAGATRAALTQHFAVRGNAADISAKEQSQETAVTVIGMLLGMLFTQMTVGNHLLEWALFASLTVLHVWSNVRAMRALVLKSLNQPRLERLVEEYITGTEVSTPVEMSQVEDLMPPPFKKALGTVYRLLAKLGFKHFLAKGELPTILFGATFEAAHGGHAKGLDPETVRRLIKEAGSQHYIVIMKQDCVQVILHSDASEQDLLRAYVHALHIKHSMETSTESLKLDLITPASKSWMEEEYEQFCLILKAVGWQIDQVRIPQEGWAASWKTSDKNHLD